MTRKIQDAVLAITEDDARTLMPKNYTGWVANTHAGYKLIEDAGIAVGRIKPQQASK